MKSLLKIPGLAVLLVLSMWVTACSDSDDEPGNSSEQVDQNALVKTITHYDRNGKVSRIYDFEYDENNNIKSWIETRNYVTSIDTDEYTISQNDGMISIVSENDDDYSYNYENGYIIGAPWTYENGKLIKGPFSSITWDGDNISQIVRSGDKHEYIYNDLKNNASINFNALIDYNMKGIINDEAGEQLVAYGFAAGTRTKNLLSEVNYELYYEGKYLGPSKDVYTYETDAENRVIKITVHDEYYGYDEIFEITYK